MQENMMHKMILVGGCLAAMLTANAGAADATLGPMKVFVLAGDENMLEQGVIGGDEPGVREALSTLVEKSQRYASLKDPKGGWVKRDDVVLYDAHPIHNSTRAMGRFLEVGAVFRSGGKDYNAIGPELMFGHVMGNHFDEPVLLLRFATRHPIWFRRGGRSLAHDFLPPSSGGGSDLDGGWDVIHFNWGIHDTARRTPPKYKGELDAVNGTITTPIDEYEKNLRTLVARLRQTGATLIWATTTPIAANTKGWINGDEVRYNAVAEEIMKANGVIIDDLHAESLRAGGGKAPNVHAVGNLAPKVTQTILAAIADRQTCTKPLPRVLMIGDSITGTYWEKVKHNLDGKAFVCKNPGNAEHTVTGLKRIDEWLDLKRYRLNGQEYLKLTDGVKDALAHLDRVHPGYKGQGAELTGLVWFQGIQDCQSDAMAAGYEKDLANLIRDLRKDLNAPDLPVVVAAIGFGGEKMRPNVQKVHDAQMAVGDPERYPEFVGNVISIDTRGFYPAAPQPKSGNLWDYCRSAESFLEIGEAMGRAMVDLIEGGK